MKTQDFERDPAPGMLRGLTGEEVLRSREAYGENLLSSRKRTGFWHSFLQNFGDPMIKILVAALAVNLLFLSQNANWFESVGIALAILLASLVSTISEYGSEAAFEKLQEEAAHIRCRVRRREGLQELPVGEVVVGDLVQLQPGERVPADGRLLTGQLEVDQSALNGESKEARKRPGLGGLSPGQEGNLLDPQLVFSGTVVTSGEGLMEVLRVGDSTFYGRIGQEIQQEARESPLRHRLQGLATSIGHFGYLAAGVSALAFLMNNIVIDNRLDPLLIRQTFTSWHTLFPLLVQACTLAVTVVVMAVPEGLPMMITVVLSANMKRMLKDQVLVRKLIGIETAGSMNILFTDKTGTLTSGQLAVEEFVDGTGTVWPRQGMTRKEKPLFGVLRDSLRYNCAAALEGKRAIGGNATDRAVLVFAQQLPGGTPGLQPRTVLPFSSQEKLMISTVAGRWNATLIKGAPEKILSRCTQYYDLEGALRPLARRSTLEQQLRSYTQQSMRVIAVATAQPGATGSGNLGPLALVGLLAIRDSIRHTTKAGVRQIQQAGIQTVMITGDAKATAAAIAGEVGILRGTRDLVLTHEELAQMTDRELTAALPNLRVVARALPGDKSRLVRVAQGAGLVVGMTGDGVNDAPALKQADVGFAMGSGTEVAKEAGDIVILDDRFESIAKAVSYGRTIFKSIRKFIIYQMSTCLCAVGVTVVGPLIHVDFPITVIQMLWINIVMDTLAGLAFSGEQPRASYMREPPKRRDEPIISPRMMNQMAVGSLYAMTLCLWFLKSNFFAARMGGPGEVYALTSFFTLFMFCALFNSLSARTHRVNLLAGITANPAFLVLMSLVAVAQIGIVFFGGPLFRTVPLAPRDLIAVILLAFTVIPVDLLRKIFISWWPSSARQAAPQSNQPSGRVTLP